MHLIIFTIRELQFELVSSQGHRQCWRLYDKNNEQNILMRSVKQQ